MKLLHTLLTGAALLAVSLLPGRAAGTLTPLGASHTPIQIRSHQVNVTLVDEDPSIQGEDGGIVCAP